MCLVPGGIIGVAIGEDASLVALPFAHMPKVWERNRSRGGKRTSVRYGRWIE